MLGNKVTPTKNYQKILVSDKNGIQKFVVHQKPKVNHINEPIASGGHNNKFITKLGFN